VSDRVEIGHDIDLNALVIRFRTRDHPQKHYERVRGAGGSVWGMTQSGSAVVAVVAVVSCCRNDSHDTRKSASAGCCGGLSRQSRGRPQEKFSAAAAVATAPVRGGQPAVEAIVTRGTTAQRGGSGHGRGRVRQTAAVAAVMMAQERIVAVMSGCRCCRDDRRTATTVTAAGQPSRSVP
jgi:hypothetical protein